MIVNLIKAKEMFSLTLPTKIKGQFWLCDFDEFGNNRKLLSIEASSEGWVAKSNKLVEILDNENLPAHTINLQAGGFHYLKLQGSDEKLIVFAEDLDDTRLVFSKILVSDPGVYTIGRTLENNIYVNNQFISANHAQLEYDGKNWIITDLGSTNGTYVNGKRIDRKYLRAGDFVYLMGFKIIIGSNYFALNNPNNSVQLSSEAFYSYVGQEIQPSDDLAEVPQKKFFYKPPRFFREIEGGEIKIDPPPQLQKAETVPLALMLGPSLTMGITSLSTGLLSLNNVLSNGGDISQALPTLLMSFSMLLGTVLWPILTKRHEKKERIKHSQKRQTMYLAYLDQIRDEIKRKSKEQSDILNENIISVDECRKRIEEEKTSLWERLIGHGDFLRLRLGVGNLPLSVDIKVSEKRFTMEDDSLQSAMFALGDEPKELVNVPISISLSEEKVVGICGKNESTYNLLKSLILQMSTLHSYDDLKIAVIADKSVAEEFDFVRVIPHLWNNDKSVRYLATDNDEVKELSSILEKEIVFRGDNSNTNKTALTPHYVIVCLSKQLTAKCEAIQQLLKFKNDAGFSIVSLSEELKDIPKEASIVVQLDAQNSKVFEKDDTHGKFISFVPDVINTDILSDLSEKLANIEIDLSDKNFSLPNMITFLEMFEVSKIEHLNILSRWKENNPTVTLQTPIGVDTAGNPFYLDLHEKYHGPHGLVAGMTGSGKSEFIITYILSLAVNYHPDEVSFVLIDYKGGGLTGAFENEEKHMKLPHLAGTITNLEGASVKRSLISIQSELRRRQAIFNEARKTANEGTMDIYKYQQLYRDKVVSEPVPHLFIISDEFAELKSQQPEFMEQLISAARIGRSLGVHLILATQKPSGVVDDQIWSNSKFRVCLKVQEKADSQDMIKCPDAAEISQTGRFYLQVGFNELFALGQSAWAGAEYIPTDTIEKKTDQSIQVVDNLGRVMMNVKPPKKKLETGKKIKQIVSIVKYLSDLASEEQISVRPLWLPPIAQNIYIDNLEEKYGVLESGAVLNPIVGEYDDPFNQRQLPLHIPLSKDGNCLIYGSTGNGKTTFLTTLCYSLIKNHTPKEVNLYIMDFGSETLKSFAKAPHVGGVVVSSDEEKLLNLFKMINAEINSRKLLFSDFGGDYASYLKNSGKTLPNIVVVLNNYSGFAEQFEDLTESFNLLTRDCVKYGIYFVVSASSTNAVRYKTLQNFKTVLTMQLNDATDYSIIVGRTEGLIPSKFKGRGLVRLDRVFEFQTAYPSDTKDQNEFLRKFSLDLCDKYQTHAKPIPVLPEKVDFEFVHGAVSGLNSLPVGVAKKSLNIISVNLKNKVVYPICAQDMYMLSPFVEEFLKVSSLAVSTTVLDMEKILSNYSNCNVVEDEFENFVIELFNNMVERNNTYKDSKLNLTSLDKFEEQLYVIFGFRKLYDILSADCKEKLSLLLEKAEAIYKIHFVIADSVSAISSFGYEAWYKKQMNGEGVWIGDGIADQYMMKINKITSELYDEIGMDYGYAINRGKPTLIKLLSCNLGEEE